MVGLLVGQFLAVVALAVFGVRVHRRALKAERRATLAEASIDEWMRRESARWRVRAVGRRELAKVYSILGKSLRETA